MLLKIVVGYFTFMLMVHTCVAQTDSIALPAPAVTDTLQQNLRTVTTYTITGAKRTKDYLVEREFAFEKGGTYRAHDLKERLDLTRQQLMNTSLFVSVDIDSFETGPNQVGITVDVKERWYVFPIPFFKIVGRNWNEWIKQYGASLNRVNYGIKIKQENLSGRNDRMNLSLVSGYTREFSFGYSAPYIDSKLRHGLGFNFQYSRNRETNYLTSNDTILNIKLPNFAYTHMGLNVAYSYRKGSKERHNIGMGLNNERIDGQIAHLNPDFFGEGRTSVTFFDIRYVYQYFNVDFIPYPLIGWYTDLYGGARYGKGVTFYTVGGKFLQSWKLNRSSYFMFQAAASIRFPFEQPYFNNRLMGFGDLTMRGLEYNVIDGSAGGMLRGTLRKKVLSFNLKTPLKSKAYNRIPFTFYAKVFTDAGYVYNHKPGNSRLSNRLLNTGGFGLDIVSIYDMAIKLEFSFNQLGGRGLFVHSSSDF